MEHDPNQGSVKPLIDMILASRLYHHQFFQHWALARQTPEVTGALFHQIQHFCAATRPAHHFPAALRFHGFPKPAKLMEAIAASEAGHGAELLRMAGFIVNRAARDTVFPDLTDEAAIESSLRLYSDSVMGGKAGYDESDGLLPETRAAMAIFNWRKEIDYRSVYFSLGVALALEIVSNRHLIPGEVLALVASGYYDAWLGQWEMTYLFEHYGGSGAEAEHELNVIEAVGNIIASLPAESPGYHFIVTGISGFVEHLARLWDALDQFLIFRNQPWLDACTI